MSWSAWNMPLIFLLAALAIFMGVRGLVTRRVDYRGGQLTGGRAAFASAIMILTGLVLCSA